AGYIVLMRRKQANTAKMRCASRVSPSPKRSLRWPLKIVKYGTKSKSLKAPAPQDLAAVCWLILRTAGKGDLNRRVAKTQKGSSSYLESLADSIIKPVLCFRANRACLCVSATLRLTGETFAYRSISPITISSEPTMAGTSAIKQPRQSSLVGERL